MRGELEALEPWVADDVDTVLTAATSMSVILNDVLDLGQVRPRVSTVGDSSALFF